MAIILNKYNKYFLAIYLTQLWGLVLLLLWFIEYSTTALSLAGYIVYFIATVLLIKELLRNHLKIRTFSFLFLIWITYLIISAIPSLFDSYNNYINLKKFISSTFFLYILPFMILAHLPIDFYKSLFKFSYKLILIYLILTVLFFLYFIVDLKRGGESLTYLMGGAAPLAMTLSYHSKRQRIVIILAILLLLFEMMILGRRNVVLYFGSVLFFSFLIGIIAKNTFSKKRGKNYFMMTILTTFFAGFIFFIFSNAFEFFFSRVQTGMESREGIIELFFNDFNSTPNDWIWGRGIFGQFEGGVLANDIDKGTRDGIENGYLYLILKGGWVYLSLLIVISLNAMYKGFFKSRNLLVKGFAAIILIYYIDMIGFGIPIVNLKYILIFIAIAACNTKWLREQTDDFLSKEIGLK